jgi:hypothetical protein
VDSVFTEVGLETKGAISAVELLNAVFIFALSVGPPFYTRWEPFSGINNKPSPSSDRNPVEIAQAVQISGESDIDLQGVSQIVRHVKHVNPIINLVIFEVL